MRSAVIICAGFVLLVASLYLSRSLGEQDGRAFGTAASFFLPVWFLISAANMFVGVYRAGYTFGEELPVFALIFLLPAIPAGLIWWRYR
jgi:hypothetical protein